MQVAIFSAISADGYLAGLDGDSDWVNDEQLFERMTKAYGCIALGRTTFEQFKDEIYPLDGVQHLVLASKSGSSEHDNVHFVTSVQEALAKAAELGFDRLLVVGGSKTNASFMSAGVVSKLLLDIHPLVLGQGLRLLGDCSERYRLSLTDCRKEDSFIHLEYDLCNESGIV